MGQCDWFGQKEHNTHTHTYMHIEIQKKLEKARIFIENFVNTFPFVFLFAKQQSADFSFHCTFSAYFFLLFCCHHHVSFSLLISLVSDRLLCRTLYTHSLTHTRNMGSVTKQARRTCKMLQKKMNRRVTARDSCYNFFPSSCCCCCCCLFAVRSFASPEYGPSISYWSLTLLNILAWMACIQNVKRTERNIANSSNRQPECQVNSYKIDRNVNTHTHTQKAFFATHELEDSKYMMAF